jgi:tetratricopeptide (TPR) repeat protein
MKRYGLLALLAVLLAVSIARNAVWHDDGDIWEDTIRKSPRKARAYNELGLHILAIGNYEKALALFGSSLMIDPYQPAVYINLGLAFEKLDQIDNAIRTYEQAISNQPSEPAAYYNLGILYYNVRGDRKKALAYLLRARDLDPREPDVHQYLGRIYYETGDITRSREENALYQQLK